MVIKEYIKKVKIKAFQFDCSLESFEKLKLMGYRCMRMDLTKKSYEFEFSESSRNEPITTVVIGDFIAYSKEDEGKLKFEGIYENEIALRCYFFDKGTR